MYFTDRAIAPAPKFLFVPELCYDSFLFIIIKSDENRIKQTITDFKKEKGKKKSEF